jgi:Resolvase, N terminal domain
MTILIKPDLAHLFDESVTQKQKLSGAARKRLYDRLYHERPSNFIGPGAEAVGKRPLKAFAYLRNSEGIFETSASLLRQIDPIRRYAQTHNIEIIRIFSDPDTKAYAMINRTGMMNCLLGLRNGEADLLLIDEASRAGRGSILKQVQEMLSQHNIPIIDAGRGKVLSEFEITLETLITSRETKNLSRRVSGGTQANTEHRKKITKRLVWGHHRNYPGGPIVCLDEGKADTIREIHRMFDEGIPVSHILLHLNAKWKEGIERYSPPGKSGIWLDNHLLSDGRRDGGILRYRDYIGEFWHGRTKNWTNQTSEHHMHNILPREQWYCVFAPEAAVFKKEEEQALFWRNQDRLLARSEKYRTRMREKSLGIASEPLKYTSNGSDRGLLSGIITCMACGTFHYGYSGMERGSRVMRCGGASRRGCSNHVRIDADKTTSIILTKLQQEISDDNTLKLYERELQDRAANIPHLSASVKKTETELKRLKEELISLFRQRASKTGTVRGAYDGAIGEIEKQIGELDEKIRLARCGPTTQSGNSMRSAELQRCRSLLERLRASSTYSSLEDDDLHIIDIVRKMISGRLHLNDHDYGASLTVTIDFSMFFTTGPIDFNFKRAFVIGIPPRETGFRPPSVDKIDFGMFEHPERYIMDDATWADVRGLLKPHWAEKKNKYFNQGRHHYDAMLLSLRAGAGPCTTHNPYHDYTPLSNNHNNIRRLRLWPQLLDILREHGHAWVDTLDQAMLRHLSGEGGDPTAPWSISPTFSVEK